MKRLHADVVKPTHGNDFDSSSLPGWARRCREVVQLCRINMEFKRNVEGATDAVYKRILIREARQICRKMGYDDYVKRKKQWKSLPSVVSPKKPQWGGE